ncbi:MFS transporter [Paenibacillus azoreducens]|uniref:MFS transporter n=1 Tax=Paenibacillus azoreducens TaxID=116718 RepID=UPI0039F53609
MDSIAKPINEKALLALLLIASSLATMNVYMFNIAVPFIIKDLHLSTSESSLVTTLYAVVLAAGSGTYGKLTDRFSARSLILIGIALFTLGSLMGVFSSSFPAVVTARIIQAAGAAAIPSLAYVVPPKYFKPENRGKALSLVSTTYALMGGVAPVLSGFIIQLFGWHGLFVVSLLIVFIIPFVVKHFPTNVAQGEKFDVLGAILFSLAVGILVLGISLNPYLLIIAVLMLIAFSFHIRGKNAPFITISLLANKNYRNSLLSVFAGTSAYPAALFLLPLVLKQGGNLQASLIGIVMFPGALIGSLFGPYMGALSRKYNGRIIILAGHGFMILGALLMAVLQDMPIGIGIVMFIFALGYTTLVSSAANVVPSTLKKTEIGIGMGLFTLLSILGGAFGPSILSRFLSFNTNFTISFIIVIVMSVIGIFLILATRADNSQDDLNRHPANGLG